MQSSDATEYQSQAEASPVRGFRQRILSIDRLFLVTVFLPTILAIIYYGFMASDVYISESRFIVRSPDRQSVSNLGLILKGAGFTRSQDDTYTVQDFIQSRDALKELNVKQSIAAAYGAAGVDRISRFGGTDFGDKSFEALHLYYRKKIVKVSQDSSSSIITLETRSFSPEQATLINEQLLQMSERLVNRMNEQGLQDMIRFAAKEVAEAEKKDTAASLALSAYRNMKGIFDPEKQSTIQLQQVARLQDELIGARTQLAQLRSVTGNNPQVPVLQKRIELLQGEIKAESARVAGGERSLSGQAAFYERLVLEQSFADKQLATALATLEQARNDAMRKQLYLERVVQPSRPDKALEPKRARNIVAALFLGLISWGVLSLLFAAIKEHRD